MAKMKGRGIVCQQSGTFDHEIDVRRRSKQYGVGRDQAAVDNIVFPTGKKIPAREGRLVNLGCGTPASELRDESSFAKPDHRADRAVRRATRTIRRRLYVLPKHLAEKVARLQ